MATRRGKDKTVPSNVATLVSVDGVDPSELPGNDAAFAQGLHDFDRRFAVVLVGSAARIIWRDRPYDPPMSPEAFMLYLRDEAKEGRDWIERGRRKQSYKKLGFDPNTLDHRLPDDAFNCWRGWAVEPSTRGSWDLARRHLYENVCGSRDQLFEYVLSWIAHLLQFPTIKPGVALLLFGPQGTGKDMCADIIARLVREANYRRLQNSQHLSDAYGGSVLLHTLLLHAEETLVTDRKAGDVLKGLITSPTVGVRLMRTDNFQVRSFMRLFLTSNHAVPVNVEPGDRRYQVIEVAEHPHTRDHSFFGRLLAELSAGGTERMMHDLLAYKITGDSVRQLIETTEHADLKTASAPLLVEFVAQFASRIKSPRAGQRWPNLHGEYLEFCKERGGRTTPLNLIAFGRAIAKLGVTRGQGTTGARTRFYDFRDPMPVREKLVSMYPRLGEHYNFSPSGDDGEGEDDGI